MLQKRISIKMEF